MSRITLKELIQTKDPEFLKKYPAPLSSFTLFILKKIFKEDKVNLFLDKLEDRYDLDFINALFKLLDFSYLISDKERMRIPAEGKLIIVANHPLGALDALALLKVVGEIRKDVKVVANELLLTLHNVKNLIIPIDYYSYTEKKQNLKLIEQSLQNEEAVIFFPAEDVSRPTVRGVRDKRWRSGAIKMAQKLQAPILPIFISGKNSPLFYSSSVLSKEISSFMLPNEVFNKEKKNISIHIGKIIPGTSLSNSPFDVNTMTRLLRKHVYLLKKGKKEVFQTEETIIHPIDKVILKNELKNSELLGTTKDGKKIFLVEFDNSHNVIMEIARLREFTFRKVGEGTGKTFDMDDYDKIYKHIVLWDDENLEIVGSYRLGVCSEIIEKHGIEKIYNTEQFVFNKEFNTYLANAVELGRSFVQMKYWGSHALDYLWQGIGAFLSKYPEHKYLFGAVSISDNYPPEAKAMLVNYHRKWFMSDENLAKAKNPYSHSEKMDNDVNPILDGETPKDDFMNLKRALRNFGMTIPVLVRRYVDITEFGGTKFIDFGVDESFANSIDCFIVVNLNMLKEDFRNRYYVDQKSMVDER